MKTNTKLFVCTTLLIALIAVACKKDETITFTGKLIFSSTDPRPVSNYELEFYQSGSPSIPIAIGSSSSSSTTITDQAGNFKHVFTLGKARLIVFSGTNSSAISINGVGNTNFSAFSLRNAPASLEVFPVFKKIDAAMLKLNSSKAIEPSDTLTITYLSTTGFKRDTVTGLTIAQGQQNISFATVSNVLFSSYDFVTKKYQNQISIYLKKNTPANSYYLLNSSLDSIGQGDESVRELLYFN